MTDKVVLGGQSHAQACVIVQKKSSADRLWVVFVVVAFEKTKNNYYVSHLDYNDTTSGVR